MENIQHLLTTVLGQGRVKLNEPMSSHTAFRAGGNAQIYMELDQTQQIIEVARIARENHVPIKILGSGTNMLIADKGFSGIIIKNNCRRFEVMSASGRMNQPQSDIEKSVLYCETGALMNQVVRYTIEQGLSGLEYQLGLPGTVGGGVYMNAQYSPKPAFVGDSLQSARILTGAGELLDVNRDYFQFGFDYSSLQKSGDILLSVVFLLEPMPSVLLWDKGQEAANYRIAEQPRQLANGVTYRNMEVTNVEASSYSLGKPNMEQVLRESGALMMSLGGVKLYENRYNYLVNNGNAKVDDVKGLIAAIKKQVKEISKVDMHFEGHVVGE